LPANGTASGHRPRLSLHRNPVLDDCPKLVAGENERSLAGVSGNLGDWDGLVFLQR
jgi:hypothetical protein